MENKKSENMWVVLIVVLVLVIFGFWSMKKASGPDEYGNTNGGGEYSSSSEDTSSGSINIGAPAATIAYSDALIKYKDARLQIQGTCQATPDKMTFKNGANVMIDNRTAAAHTVKVGTAFDIKAYGFKIVNLSSSTLPATWLIDCDKSQNVATITIQK